MRITSARAQVLGAQVITDTYGTALGLTANTAGSVLVPDACIGCLIYSPNADVRLRLNASASTALTWPTSGYLRGDTEYSFVLNPDSNNLSFISTIAGTPEVTWIIGAGA